MLFTITTNSKADFRSFCSNLERYKINGVLIVVIIIIKEAGGGEVVLELRMVEIDLTFYVDSHREEAQLPLCIIPDQKILLPAEVML